jgi:sigma-B regulation protein RsbU (phosphoserine phosphatase)
MIEDRTLWQRLGQLDRADPNIAFLIQRLLDCRASTKDSEVNSQLLQDIILKYAAAEAKLVRLNRELYEKQRSLDEDLSAAAEIQLSLLPQKIEPSNHLRVSWSFRPCEKIGGDIFNLIQLDPHHWGIYVLDVSGHGVPAAMVAVSVYQFLQSHTGFLVKRSSAASPVRYIRTPGEVFAALEREFPFERFTNFFTITYFVLNTATGRILYGNAGHPLPILLRKSGGVEKLTRGGPPIGLTSLRNPSDGQVGYSESIADMTHGDKLFVFTDGILDYQDPEGNFFGSERLYRIFSQLPDQPVSSNIATIEKALADFGNKAPLHDDITLLGLEYLGEGRA